MNECIIWSRDGEISDQAISCITMRAVYGVCIRRHFTDRSISELCSTKPTHYITVESETHDRISCITPYSTCCVTCTSYHNARINTMQQMPNLFLMRRLTSYRLSRRHSILPSKIVQSLL